MCRKSTTYGQEFDSRIYQTGRGILGSTRQGVEFWDLPDREYKSVHYKYDTARSLFINRFFFFLTLPFVFIGSNGRPHVKLILWFSSACDKKVDSAETKTTWLFIGIGAGVNVVLVLAIGIGIAMRARARYGVSRSCLMPSELSIGNATFSAHLNMAT